MTGRRERHGRAVLSLLAAYRLVLDRAENGAVLPGDHRDAVVGNALAGGDVAKAIGYQGGDLDCWRHRTATQKHEQ